MIICLLLLVYVLFEEFINPWLNRLFNKIQLSEKEEPKGFHKLDARARELNRH